MNKILAKYQDISLSNYDIFNILNKKIRILTYPELVKYNDIEDVLKPNDCFILLYMTHSSYGHWVSCIKHENSIEFFDSYGDSQPDDELKKISLHFRKESNQLFPHLTWLLYKSKYPIEYNDFDFQQHNNDVKTCGRHCAVRCLLKKLSLKNYTELMEQLSYEFKLNYDQIVTILTM